MVPLWINIDMVRGVFSLMIGPLCPGQLREEHSIQFLLLMKTTEIDCLKALEATSPK